MAEALAQTFGTFRFEESYRELKRLSQLRKWYDTAKSIEYAIAGDQSLEKIQEKIQLFDVLDIETISTQQTMQEIVEELTGLRQSVYYPTKLEAFDLFL